MSKDPTPETAQGGQQSKSYPKPQADYQEIAQNPQGFLQKLQSFHSSFGTKFKVPTVGGNSLDLHRLFLEVTSRGGIEKVIRDRRWKEIARSFKFPSSITSASFVLRKYYFSLLYHFEQVYFFRRDEPPVSNTEPATQFVNGSTAMEILDNGGTDDQCSEIPKLEPGSSVTGTIDAKFDYGYVVTVNLGTQKYKGVLYHASAAPGPTPRERRRHQLGLKDPSRPRPNMSGYNFFFQEHYCRLKPSYQGQERAISKKIGVLWNRLSEAEKQVESTLCLGKPLFSCTFKRKFAVLIALFQSF
ncbi:hypothetical protein M9H77_14983 [Catharanthus roseus]|uniref:Uncharacterized protein n=1 Tax=Catharanthus roseus TaxID=4058 RepID=A0ACC0BPV9_CATRO|nr:hypothetical protein M9H77_14983 [Catharanthus roseus]